ncbi:MAG: tRNA pseudouridine(38-40) synthase TruA [Myxococcales bacterium]|nr:tRNA pseudouridine(38-40) synthase TruA [Myxococcales bacterium]MCB9693035.1 tRNA pseudouridine(38-40) synthase TruA [Alphaproteobacteria bacterium]
MQRWRLDLEYDGAPFAGWQIQPGAPTIQQALEDAVLGLFGEHARVCASGRTDAGVHAEHQVATFVSAVERSERAVRDGLNAGLPAAIVVTRATRVPPEFDPRRQVKTKTYRYQWLDREVRSPFLAGRAWHQRRRLDVAAMHAAVQALDGTHDFEAFRAQGCQADHAVRTIGPLRVEREGDLVCLRVQGHGFLRHMIRIVAGTITEVGQGRREPGWVAEVLASRDRTRAGRTAPPHGLTLEAVSYPDE